MGHGAPMLCLVLLGKGQGIALGSSLTEPMQKGLREDWAEPGYPVNQK